MKLSTSFAIALLFNTIFLPIASPSLSAKGFYGLLTRYMPRLTASQKSALKVLALDDEAHKKVVDRADPSKVTKFMKIHELFRKGSTASTMTSNEEIFDLATAYVPCEIAWHLRIIEFDETIQCLGKSASWKVTSKIGDLILVNFFADKHAFELVQLLKTTDVGDEELFLDIQKLLSSEGLLNGASPAFFLQHALALHKQSPTSLERQEMVKSFLSLHLSALATRLHDQAMIKALYTELVHDVPTLFTGTLPEHAIAVVATRVKKDKSDIVIVNSGDGIKNHASIKIQLKGFHTGASYGDVSTSDPIEATSYNPLLRMKGVTGAQLASAHYHSGTVDQVYYMINVVKEPLMPWEWAERQGTGTCAATSIWFALHFYYQVLGYENDIRLSILDQAIDDLKELQDKVEDLERKVNAGYRKPRKGELSHPLYDKYHIKDSALAKDKAEKSLHLRRAIISMTLSEILRNGIVWQHELGDIKAGLFIKDKDPLKLKQRREVLEKAVPQTMASFHGFWALQDEKYLKRKQGIVDAEAELSGVLDSWQSIRADVRTMYNDAIRVTGIKPGFATALAKPPSVKQTFKPINVTSLKEHASLRRILRYITNFGDSPALRVAVSRHLKVHTKNANAAMYLIMLGACLAKSLPLLNHLVVAKELPLLYTIDATAKDTGISMYWDLEREEDIAALAAHEFAQYGQPLDAFPEVFKVSRKETQGIVDRFKDVYKEITPIITAEAPSQDNVDEAFEALVKDNVVSAIAYILPKTSRKAISAAFLESKSVSVLRLLIDLVQDPKLLEQKIEANSTNVEIVELVLSVYLRYRAHVMEKSIIKKQSSGSAAAGKPEKTRLPSLWLESAYYGNAVQSVELLAPFSNESAIVSLLSAAAKDGNSEMTLILVDHAKRALSTAITQANKGKHVDLERTLFERYARPIEVSFVAAAEQGNLDVVERLMQSVSTVAVGYALLKAAESGKMDCFEKLVPHSSKEWASAARPKLSDENARD